MASASDVRDILNLSASAPVKAPPTKKAPSRKDTGITRELYSLIGDHAPTLVARPKLKQKPNLGTPKVRWEMKRFHNGARADGLVLRHWVKAEGDGGGSEIENGDDYQFARFGKMNSGTSYSYSMDEYTRMLEDGDWSKEETDYLFAIVREYDVRFYVIADRYDFPGGRPRTMQVGPYMNKPIEADYLGTGSQIEVLWCLQEAYQKSPICRRRVDQKRHNIELLL